MQNSISSLLKRKVTRKQFILYIFFLLFSLTGIQRVFKQTNPLYAKRSYETGPRKFGYGKYGV